MTAGSYNRGQKLPMDNKKMEELLDYFTVK